MSPSLPTKRAEIVAPFVAAAIAQVVALVYYRTSVLHLATPLDLTGDSLQKLQLVTAAVRDGWILHNSSIGLPGQAQHLDFPRYDSLNYAIIKLFAWATGDGVVAANLYFLAGYGLVALSACWVLLRLGMTPSWSVVGALAYAWLPYHQLRGFDHFTNAAYWLVPLAMWFLRRVWYPHPGGARFGRREWVCWFAFGVVLELQNPYYAIFFAALAGSVALLLSVLRGFGASRQALIQTGAVLGIVALTFVGEQLPRWLFEAANGKNALALVRPPNGPSAYALSIADLVSPSPDHPIAWLAQVTRSAADARGVKANERVDATLPLLGLFGLVVGMVALLRRAKLLEGGDAAARLRQWTGAMILVSLAWCHEGALCTLLAECGLGAVRAWNRMSTYIAFATIVAAVSVLDQLSRGRSEGARRWLVGAVGVVVMAEQLLAAPRSTYAAAAPTWQEAKQLGAELTADGRLHRAFVLPFIEYPEAGKIGTIRDYDHFVLAVASERLAVSYGSMRGRGAHYFSSAANDLHGAELPGYLRDGGFDTLIVDTFSTATATVRDEVRKALGTPVARSSRFLAYRIAPPEPQAPRESQWRAYALGSALNFRDVANRRYLELNFSNFEPDGTWTIGPLAALRLYTPALPMRVILTIDGELFEDPLRPQRVRVVFDGQPVCSLDRSAEGSGHHWTCSFSTLPNSRAPLVHEIRFEVAHPVSPAMLKRSNDSRLLGLRLTSLQLDAAN